MALTVRQVRDRIADGITEALGSSGWTESRTTYDLFPRDTRALSHKSFAVGALGTVPGQGDRQNDRRGTTTRGAIATTAISVRFAFRLRADAQAADYGAALDAEGVLTKAILGVDRDPQLSVRILRVPLRRGDAGEGTAFLGQLDFEVLHRLALE